MLGWGCITSTKYEQTATLLRQGGAPIYSGDEVLHKDHEDRPTYDVVVDPISGEIIRDWDETIVTPDDPNTTDIDETEHFTFKCQARGVITGGINVQGTAERWTAKGTYENVDTVTMTVPKNVIISKRDRITDITNSNGDIVWREEEGGSFRPTVFSVRGVTPVLDPFGSLVEWFVMLERASVQDGVEQTTKVTEDAN